MRGLGLFLILMGTIVLVVTISHGLYWLCDKVYNIQRDLKMAQADIDRLKQSVQRNTDATNSAVTLIKGLAQQIRDAADDPAELKTLADQIDAQATTLGQAVTENTQSA